MKCNPTRESSCSFLNHSIKLVYEPADVVFVLSTPVQLIFPSTMNVVKELIVLSSKEEFCARLIYFFFLFLILLCCFLIFPPSVLYCTLTLLTANSRKVWKRYFFSFFFETINSTCRSGRGLKKKKRQQPHVWTFFISVLQYKTEDFIILLSVHVGGCHLYPLHPSVTYNDIAILASVLLM